MGEITDRVSELEARQEKLELDLVEARMILRDQVGTAFETVPECAREAARLLEALRDDRARSPDYARTLQNIDKMLKHAFPGDIATIEGRVAAACENTKALREAQDPYLAENNKALSDALDRHRRLTAEANKKLLQAKRELDHYQGACTAQRARADEAEAEVEKLRKQRPEGVSTERFAEVETVKNYWKTLAEVNANDLTEVRQVRDTWQRMAEDNGKALAAANEKLRRKSHETPVASSYEEAAERMREIRKIAGDRGSFWVQGVRYVPDCRTEVNADAVAKLEKIAQMLEAFKK